MRKKILFFIFCLAQFHLLAQKEAWETNKIRLEAMVRQDSAALSKYMAEDLIYIHSNGLVESKMAHIGTIMQQKIIYQQFVMLSQPKITKSKKLTIIIGKVEVTGLYNGVPFKMPLHFTAIYKKKKKIWQLSYWQSTKATS
jgi:Domain of unknown function (DUF4440)